MSREPGTQPEMKHFALSILAVIEDVEEERIEHIAAVTEASTAKEAVENGFLLARKYWAEEDGWPFSIDVREFASAGGSRCVAGQASRVMLRRSSFK